MKKGIIRLIKAIQYSCEGIKSAFISEIAFRQELLLFIVCVSILFVLDVSNLERAVMISSLFLVLIVEIVNTAFETTIERISSEQHILSKKVKDLGSAAVFLSLIIAFLIIVRTGHRKAESTARRKDSNRGMFFLALFFIANQ